METKNPIYLSSWSIRRQIETKKLSLAKFFDFAVENSFDGVEIVDRHLHSLAENYINSLARAKLKSGIGINLAVSNDFTSERPNLLQMQVNYVLNMIRLAEQLEARTIRIFLGGFDNFFQKILKKILTRKTDSTELQSIKRQKSLVSKLLNLNLFRLVHAYSIKQKKPQPFAGNGVRDRILKALDSVLPLAEQCSITLAIENHWGVSLSSQNVLEIINNYKSPYLGTCPDFGNFSSHQNRYQELAKLLPFARTVHAKSYRFAEDGEETTINYARCMALIKEINFNGPITVEYEGDDDQLIGSFATQDLIQKYL
jgi:L-ribulose-5-phosphate 3-epimerase